MVVFLQACATTKFDSLVTAGKISITHATPACIFAAAGNNLKFTYFEMSKPHAVAAGMYRVAKPALLLDKWACPSKSH